MIAFKNIIIRQFRAYKNVKISFTENTGVILMSGDNGSGKSTLLNAINWCLYGDTPFFTIKEVKNVSNKHAGDNAVTEVDITAISEGTTFRFFRKAQKGDNIGRLEVSYESEGNWQVLNPSDSAAAIKRILPKDIRHLFFFNGERLKDIFSQNSDHDLKSSVYKVSELNIIDNAVEHLRIAGQAYLKSIESQNRNADKIRKLNNERAELEIKIAGYDEQINSFRNEKRNIKEEVKKLDKLIIDTATARELIANRDLLKQQIDECEVRLNNKRSDEKTLLQNNYHRALLFKESAKYRSMLEKAREKGLIPPPVSPKVTNQILSSKTCICGRSISEREAEFIEKQHNDYKAKDELQFLTDGIYAFSDVSNQLSTLKESFKNALDDIKADEDMKRNLQTNLKKVNERLSDIDESNLHDNPEARRGHLENKLSNLDIIIAGQGSDKVRAEDELKRVNDELKKNIKEDHNTDVLERKRLKVEELQNIMRRVKRDMEQAIRDKLQKSVWETFSSILPETNFKSVTIDENYDISLKANDGIVYPTNDLSVGQTKALGLSLTYGLSKDLGYSNIPLLIDNLYGDLSEAHYGDVTKVVESLSNDKQVLIMDLNVDKTQFLFNPNNIKQLFEIERSADDNETLIKEVDRG